MVKKFVHKSEGPLRRVFDHWDDSEELCVECREWWLDRSNSFRKEAHYTYDFESVE